MSKVVFTKVAPPTIYIDDCKENRIYAFVNENDKLFTLKYNSVAKWHFSATVASVGAGECCRSTTFIGSIKAASERRHDVHCFSNAVSFGKWLVDNQ